MRSTFWGLEISKTGLFTSQRQMDVTGHNIANADTEGYSRQRIMTSAIEPSGQLGRLATATRGQVGGGVQVDMVDQIRSSFLDRQYRNQQPTLSNWTTRAQELDYIQALFNEASDESLTASIHAFFLSFNNLASNPENMAMRKSTLQLAEQMVYDFHDYHNQLMTMQENLNQKVEGYVQQINTMADRISELNVQIAAYEITGEKANDLRDKRNLLMDELSTITNYTYSEQDGRLSIKIGDRTLVSHDDVNYLVANRSRQNPATGELNTMNGVYWKADGDFSHDMTGVITGGELRATLDLIYGEDENHVGIPYIAHQLDQLANAVVQEVNKLHQQGWTFPYTTSDDPSNIHVSQNNTLFFVQYQLDANGQVALDGSGNPIALFTGNKITAKSIDIAQAIRDNVANIAIADNQQFHEMMDPDNPRLGKQELALEIGKLLDKTGLQDIGSISGGMSLLVTGLGVQANKAENMADSETIINGNIVFNRLSIMGVSMEEELTNLIKFNRSYGAASRMITAMDEMLDVMINRMGLVGRS